MITNPPILFPGTVLMLDDCDETLRCYKNILSETLFYDRLIATIDVGEAFALIKDEKLQEDILSTCFQAIETDTDDERYGMVNCLKDYHKLLYRGERYDLITTLIVDYEMPGTNGLEFCKSITGSHVRKILVTGVAGLEDAVAAFNAGLIDGYISKADPNFKEILAKTIEENNKQFFCNMFGSAFERTRMSTHEDTLVGNPKFLDLFDRILKENHIVEYYQFKFLGSFILIDKNGNTKALFAETADKFQADKDEAKSALTFDEIRKDIAQSVLSEDGMVCIHYGDTYNEFPSTEEWENFVNKTQTIADEEYYVAFGDKGLGLNTEKLAVCV